MKVNVLMSTYNGERFLQEQINSILLQRGVKVDLLVRDDGSKDKTLSILDEYKEKKQLTWFRGKNLKPAKSFLELLRRSYDNADFYAFSDQDDYWEKDKLEVATNSLQQYSERPALYFSRTQLVDAELHPTQNIAINPLLTFGESLIYEFIPGCTIVMNRQMRDLINTYTPDYLPMHDVWVYCIAQAVRGKIIFDKTPHILYRQHENNTIGQGYSRWHEWHRRWNRFLNNEQSRYRRAYELRKGFGKVMPAENLQLLDLFIAGKTNFYKRGGMVLDKRLRCANSTTQKLFWLNLLINKY